MPFFRPARRRDATRTYYVLNAVATGCFSLSFAVNMVYMATEVGLDPLQLVLVGTALELTCFLFEVPTGIVADLYSRRASVLIGFALIGGGLLLQAVPLFAAVLGAQVVWGIGYTFTSGASQAWIADEVGQDRGAQVFTREQQVNLAAGFTGTLAAGLLSLLDLVVPMVLSGLGFLALTLWLLRVMPEHNFSPTPRGQRETFRHMAATFRAGLHLARWRPVVRGLLLVSLVVGLASEAFDRLWLVRIVQDFPLPPLLGSDNVGSWFALFGLAGSAVALLASLGVNRLGLARLGTISPGKVLAVLGAIHVVSVLGVALGGSLWLVLAAFWLRGAVYAVAAPVEAAWLTRELRADTRATVLSMNGQVNAVGEILGGPPLGALAGRTSVPAALAVSAGLLSPVVAIYGWLSRRHRN